MPEESVIAAVDDSGTAFSRVFIVLKGAVGDPDVKENP
jgi:hypothetical protein